MQSVDAVVIGAGHNGLVAANDLADAGWEVVVVDAAEAPGGAVRSAETTAPGFQTDLFSAFYPMTAASPVMARLGLQEHGLRWAHAPVVLGHAAAHGPAVLLHRNASLTADGLDRAHRGDGKAWLELAASWDRFGAQMLSALLGPFPPVRAGLRLAAAARTEVFDLARLAILPVRRLGEERFGGPDPTLLLAGNALHADVPPEAAPSALLGWMLCGLAQTVGFPVPVGGAGQITAALVDRLSQAGGVLRCRRPVERIEVSNGRAAVVHTGAGPIAARRAVIAACDAQVLYDHLVDPDDLPVAFRAGLRRFHRAHATVKVNWALRERVPWSDPGLRGAGTVHIADSLDELTLTAAELAMGQIPAKPFLLVGQMTTSDPTRSPAGTESLWAYTHVPQHIVNDAGGQIDATGLLIGPALDRFVERMEDRLEAHAPGFRSAVMARHVQGPADLQSANPSLVGGDIGGGSSQLHQQLIFRPVPGLARPETPIAGLFLGSASAHPGGSVHGACGANAARAAIWHDRGRRLRSALARRASNSPPSLAYPGAMAVPRNGHDAGAPVPSPGTGRP
ncbi:MAG: NAD(P)/FAD-dependent oxidoreductase [Acidimicrobiales bacterium]|nr:NAD(P)/FAD-dependent oxidoreductase [Acidimicrobiales bacterium]